MLTSSNLLSKTGSARQLGRGTPEPEERVSTVTPLLCFPGELSAVYAQCAQGVPGEWTDQSVQV